MPLAIIDHQDYIPVHKDRLSYLINRDYILSKLEAAGVDNWDGYDYAFEEGEEDDGRL